MSDKTKIRVLTYNIKVGGTDRRDSIVKLLSIANPDIIILQEVNSTELVKDVAEALQMPYFYFDSNPKFGLALISKYCISQVKSHKVFFMRQKLLEAAIDCGVGVKFKVFGVHLIPYYSFIFELWRLIEISWIMLQVRQSGEDICVMAGDFNTAYPGDVVLIEEMPLYLRVMLYAQGNRIFYWTFDKILKSGFVDCYRAKHPFDNGFTLPTPRPHVRLDYILTRKNFIGLVRDCDVLNDMHFADKASDHYPVFATFVINSRK